MLVFLVWCEWGMLHLDRSRELDCLNMNYISRLTPKGEARLIYANVGVISLPLLICLNLIIRATPIACNSCEIIVANN